MKRILITVLSLVLIVCCLFASGCKKQKTFGEFSYNNIWLYTFAARDISYNEAKDLVHSGLSSSLYNNGGVTLLSTSVTPLSVNPTDPLEAPLPSDELVTAVTSKYANVEIITKYYVTGEKDQLTKIDTPMGTDFKNLIRYNEFAPFSQLVTKGIIIFDELIDFMQAENDKFVETQGNTNAPFNSIFSYHMDDEGNIVIQTRDFAEIPSSVGGGVGCCYRQDTEQLYDSENKLVKWQTSLGVYTATPNGTLKQGYILEVEFHWIEKQ